MDAKRIASDNYRPCWTVKPPKARRNGRAFKNIRYQTVTIDGQPNDLPERTCRKPGFLPIPPAPDQTDAEQATRSNGLRRRKRYEASNGGSRCRSAEQVV